MTSRRPPRAAPDAQGRARRCAEALAAGAPVVALESTIISHGMPYPQNVAMAREVEQIVRDDGAVPATIAVLDGRPTVGLDDAELELLGSNSSIRKVSVRDLPYVVATGNHGATTVASTMRIAGLAGIRVFVTGGLGGVHQGAENSMDVSADLTELSRTRGRRHLGRGEVDPRHRPHPRGARDARRARRRLRHRRVPLVLLPLQRALHPDAARHPRGGRGA